ncbi:uncharacterized protein LOC132720511 [Ruditapes philippinarum]|uniref:uncharacterized protein LOC132720511 n=1 Tax=Ruditapes philippinarum TaxID=129788 RepID=UPI00295A7982|nr:uncharacterized protein LOC132720511 [Ruditapes philippinarum]
MTQVSSGMYLFLILLFLCNTVSTNAATAPTTTAATTEAPTTNSATTTTDAVVANNATTDAVVANNATTVAVVTNPTTKNSTNNAVTTDTITTKNVTDADREDSLSWMSDARIVIIILASLLGLVFLFLFLAACAWLTSNSARKHRYGRYRGRRRRRRYDFEEYPSSEPSSYADEIYVPFDGPPEVTLSYKKSSALEPYYSLPRETKYSPYLFDDDMGQYMKGDLNPYQGYDFDRPYFSSAGLRSSIGRYPSDWYRSMPVNLELALPRPWLR